MKKILLLFIGSFLVTAVFSASLKVFFESVSWREVLTKGLVIPCFTWTIQLLLSAIFLDGRSRLRYWDRLGWVCLIGSIALLPAAFYLFAEPEGVCGDSQDLGCSSASSFLITSSVWS